MSNRLRVTCFDTIVAYDDASRNLTESNDSIWVFYLKIPAHWYKTQDLRMQIFKIATHIYADWNQISVARASDEDWSRYLLKRLHYQQLDPDEVTQRVWQGAQCYIVDEHDHFAQINWQDF